MCQEGYPTLQRLYSRPHAVADPVAAITDELSNTIRASDGLHPLESESLAKMEVAIRGSHHHQQPYLHAKRNFSTVEPSEFDPGSQYGCGPTRGATVGGGGGDKLQNQDSFVTSRNSANGETVLHLAARMNIGTRGIRRLCGTLVADDDAGPGETTLALLCLDKDGRSPLTASAATDGLETTTALYRLEREAITCSRSAAAAASAATAATTQPAMDGVEGGGPNAEKAAPESASRRRTRHAESRRSTPLMVALKAGCTDVTKLLLDEGCSIQGVDETGRNLAHWAAVLNAAPLLTRISHTKGFTRMLEARDDCDRTPLMLAVRENSLEAAQILLEHQAAIDVFDFTESSPLSEARAKGYTRMLTLLMEHKQRRKPAGGGGAAVKSTASKERRGSESSTNSTNSDDGTGSEFGAARGSTDNATVHQYTPHYLPPKMSPSRDPPVTATTANSSKTDTWHQKSCGDSIKLDPSCCGPMKQEEHISPQAPSTWSPPLAAPSSTKELSPPEAPSGTDAGTMYWQHQSYPECYQQYNSNSSEACGEPRFPAPFPGIGYGHQHSSVGTVPLSAYARRYPEDGPPIAQQNGVCSNRSGRNPSFISAAAAATGGGGGGGGGASARGMFIVQL